MKTKRILALVLTLILAGGGVLQSLGAKSNNYSDVISFAPSCSYQRILYEVPQYNDKTGLGFGVLVGYDSFKNSGSSFGLQLTAEYFDYPISYNYIDLKLSGTFKFRLIPLNNSDTTAKLFVTLGAGADFVFRDDGDYGAYIHLAGGLEFVLYGDDRNDVVFRTDVAGTFQKGSTVLHASVGLGVRLGFGKSFDEKPAAEPVKEEPVHVHVFDGTWVHDELNHWHVCSVCGEKYDVHEHDYPVLPNRIEISGYPEPDVKWYHVCSVCGALRDGNNPYYGIRPEAAVPQEAEVVPEPVQEAVEEPAEETVSIVILNVNVEDHREPEHVHTYNALPEIIIINRGENGLEVKWYHICSGCGELIEGNNPFYDALYGDQAKGGSV